MFVGTVESIANAKLLLEFHIDHLKVKIDYFQMILRPCSVDFMDGGATDVPILGPMELKNCISV